MGIAAAYRQVPRSLGQLLGLPVTLRAAPGIEDLEKITRPDDILLRRPPVKG